ncbi:hypothetical protein D3C80_2179210 [compost metagenome]
MYSCAVRPFEEDKIALVADIEQCAAQHVERTGEASFARIWNMLPEILVELADDVEAVDIQPLHQSCKL